MANQTILPNQTLSKLVDVEDPFAHVSRDILILILYTVTAFIAIFGNILVCYTIRQRKHLQNSTTFVLIYSMAISDIMGGAAIPGQYLLCSTMMLDLGWFTVSLCALVKTLQILSYYVSSLTMLAMAYDRYRLVCHPQSARVPALYLLIACWSVSFIFLVMNFFSMRVPEYFSSTSGIITCRNVFNTQFGTKYKRARYMFLFFTQYVLPLMFTALFYILVAHRIWLRQEMTGTKSEQRLQQFDERKRATVRMLVVVTILFALSYVPNHVVHLLKYYSDLLPEHRSKHCHKSTFYVMCYWIAISNCAYNPFVYYYFNRKSLQLDSSWIARLACCCSSRVTNKSSKEISLVGTSTVSSSLRSNSEVA